MGYIDSHSHIFYEGFDTGKAIEHIKEEKLTKVLIVCLNVDDAKRAIELARSDNTFDVAIGIHPSDIKDYNKDILNEIEVIAKDNSVVAVGEIGLDYHWDKDNHDDQKEWFIAQIELANRVNKPIIIHSRDAIEDTYDILKDNKCNNKGIMHCYSSSKEMAREFVKLGYYISLAGPVTFKNARVPQSVAVDTPLEWLLAETDCPFLTPEPYRGKENEPAYVKYNYAKIAELRNISIEEVVNQFEVNYNNIFHK